MRSINLSASKISVITGDNRFESLRDFTIELWKRFHYDNYIETKFNFESKRQQSIKTLLSKKKIEETIKLLEKKTEKSLDKIKNEEEKIKIKKKITKANKEIKEILNKSILDDKSKNELKKKINNFNISKEEKELIENKLKDCSSVDTSKPECKKKYIKKETDRERIKRVEKEKKINISSELKIISKNTDELDKKRIKLVKKIEKSNLKQKEKKELKKSIISVSNKKYGTNRENKTIQFFKEKFNKEIIIDKKYYRKKLYTKRNISFGLIGEIDGLLDDDTIIEVKNRTRRLFYRLYNYEKVQIMIYLYLLNKKKAILLEHYNDKMNDINIFFEREYINLILKKINKFTDFYVELINNLKYKRIVLLGSNKEFNELYNSNK